MKRLVEKSDILVENFQTGTRLGRRLGYSRRQLRARYGPDHRVWADQPKRTPPGFARIANAFGDLLPCGRSDIPSTPGSDDPGLFGGLYGLSAPLAIRGRELTGEGQYVDIGLYEPVPVPRRASLTLPPFQWLYP